MCKHFKRIEVFSVTYASKRVTYFPAATAIFTKPEMDLKSWWKTRSNPSLPRCFLASYRITSGVPGADDSHTRQQKDAYSIALYNT